MVEMRDIVSKLLELTHQNRVPWKELTDGSTFVAEYGDLSVMIMPVGAESEGSISLVVFDDAGTIVDRASYYGPSSILRHSKVESLDHLEPLYDAVKRTVLGVDQQLATLLERMNSTSQISLQKPQ